MALALFDKNDVSPAAITTDMAIAATAGPSSAILGSINRCQRMSQDAARDEKNTCASQLGLLELADIRQAAIPSKSQVCRSCEQHDEGLRCFAACLHSCLVRSSKAAVA